MFSMSEQSRAHVPELMRQFNMALIDNGFGMKRSQIKKLNNVDFTPLFTTQPEDEVTVIDMPAFHYPEYIAWLKEQEAAGPDNAFVLTIPCFDECVYRLNKNRYVHIKIVDIDMKNHTVTLWVQDYCARNMWEPGPRGNIMACMKQSPDGAPTFDIKSSAGLDYYDLYANANKYVKGWNPTDKDAWQAIVNYSKNFQKQLAQRGTTAGIELGSIIFRYTGMLNYMLHANKPKTSRKPKNSSITAKSQPVEAPQKPSDEPRTRTIGLITVKSVSVPRQSTVERVYHYKTASWTARGGVRHMKDGRVIPFRESVRRRKALIGTSLDTNAPERPQHIRLTDNTTAGKIAKEAIRKENTDHGQTD